MKKRLAVVYGGFSSENKISQKSAGVVFEHIDRDIYDPYLVEISEQSWHVNHKGGVIPIDKNKFSFLENDIELTFDLAFITIHGTPGEDGKLQSYFDMIGLPYANTNSFGAAITFNKWACNSFLRAFGISTAKAILIRKNDKFNPIEIADEIGFPCFVKPNGAGSSFGITKVKTLMQMPEAIAKAFEEDDEVVVEALLTGREITCGVYRVGNKVYPLPPTEIIAEGEFFDYEAKYEGKSQEITPAEIGDAAIEKIQNTAKSIFRRLDLKGFARIDFMFSEDGVPNLIEVNTNPGMSEASLIPQQIRVAGLDLKTVLTEILGAVEI
ncbi:D-alanine--D-alanine ligase [Crocinitomix catalasitica]|uniref:D-alanine--D-alanine ligase n=1 Tax=Crocinitomix catalasitica TaxID=184607 RepID=UPI0004864EB0|nr:D-alanine--D-alanine ligase [Crocinitomix catalasitica]